MTGNVQLYLAGVGGAQGDSLTGWPPAVCGGGMGQERGGLKPDRSRVNFNHSTWLPSQLRPKIRHNAFVAGLLIDQT